MRSCKVAILAMSAIRWTAAFLAFSPAITYAESPAKVPVFDTEIKPLFTAKCGACHAATPQGKLDLRTSEAILKGGASGPVVVPGDAAKSLLIEKIVTGQMPPGKTKLTTAEVDAVRGWIDKGLKTISVEKIAAASPVNEIEVRAILQVRCVACHGGTRREGGLDLRTVASRLKGGKSGPALVPGKPDESPMYKRIVNGTMPPERAAKLAAVELATPPEVEKLRAWIAAGAPEAVAAPMPARP
jgi:mono/diheme cytochrome c family protein